VVSLYGERQAPTAAMLRDVDVLVYDVQDVGARAYTFVWTMALAMRAAGRAGKPVLVLDRPNPIRADRVGGGLIEPGYRTITGLHPVPTRYGLTRASWRAGSSGAATCAPRWAWSHARVPAEPVVRRDGDPVGAAVAEHPRPGDGAALPGLGVLRGDERERGARDRRPAPRRRRALARPTRPTPRAS
jgi:hypothetical protein